MFGQSDIVVTSEDGGMRKERKSEYQGTKLFCDPEQLLKEPIPSETKKGLPRKKELLPPMEMRHLE